MIKLAELRTTLFEMDNQEMTVKELRALLTYIQQSDDHEETPRWLGMIINRTELK